jgi:hypothetical protein
MAWCVLRGGHFLRWRDYVGQFNDIMLDCTECDWSLLIVRKLAPGTILRGQHFTAIHIDEAP